jgi:hypothetical protein
MAAMPRLIAADIFKLRASNVARISVRSDGTHIFEKRQYAVATGRIMIIWSGYRRYLRVRIRGHESESPLRRQASQF